MKMRSMSERVIRCMNQHLSKSHSSTDAECAAFAASTDCKRNQKFEMQCFGGSYIKAAKLWLTSFTNVKNLQKEQGTWKVVILSHHFNSCAQSGSADSWYKT